MRGEIVRQARSDDAQSIAIVHAAVYRETYANLLPAYMIDGFSVERRVKAWRQIIEYSPGVGEIAVFVVSDVEKAIVGFGSCSRQRDEYLAGEGFNGEFQALYVLGSAQGHGIGRKLMAEMARYLISRSLSSGSCWVLRENTGATRFYEMLGGQLVTTRVHRLGVPSIERVEVAYGWRHLDSLLGK
jgi:ribosomal protein S18 acetylase RimI-like enzyme